MKPFYFQLGKAELILLNLKAQPLSHMNSDLKVDKELVPKEYKLLLATETQYNTTSYSLLKQCLSK